MENVLKGVAITTQTTQSRSLAALNEAEKDSTANKPGTEDITNLLFTVFKNLNELYEKLNRLSYVMGKKLIEQNLHQKGEGEMK